MPGVKRRTTRAADDKMRRHTEAAKRVEAKTPRAATVMTRVARHSAPQGTNQSAVSRSALRSATRPFDAARRPMKRK